MCFFRLNEENFKIVFKMKLYNFECINDCYVIHYDIVISICIKY